MMEPVSASEIEKYTYCPLSWWLSRKGVEGKGKELREGIGRHHEIEKNVEIIKKEEEKLFSSEFMIAVLSTTATILSLVGVGIYFSQQREFESAITMVISAIWLVSAAVFMVVALKSTQLARSARDIVDLPDGTIEYVSGEGVEDLFSKKTGLIGKPDYVLRVHSGSFVPIEIKTGRVPRGPLFSHIMQLTVYCVLVEEKYGKAEYGMLMYGNQIYKISLTDELKTTLFKKVDEMREAFKTDIVHRNHNRPGKCRHCSRRNACPESLA